MENDIVDRLTDLENEVAVLRAKVDYLEEMTGAQREYTEKKKTYQGGEVKKESPRNRPETALSWESFSFKDGLEQLIGGKVLNRVGILILLFGTAYFLKYAFDNQWIGEVGRIIIGLVAGISLMAAGDLLMRRKYHYFSQGLSGGGIAVIYLTVYAAANYYDLFSPAVALGFLVVTAMAGGLLSVRQDAFGVAVFSTIGGFFSPFLIGSDSSNTLFLFSYLAVVGLMVLYLAYYKNWRSLNFLAFFGTSGAYIAYNLGTESAMLLNQVFLILYFVIFGALAFLYNVRYKRSTTVPDILLAALNAGFFTAATIGNLFEYSDAHGLIAVLLASIYLVVSLTLHKKGLGDRLLFQSMLGIGLALVTLAILLQLEGEWRNIAWAVEAVVLVNSGLKGNIFWIRRAGTAILMLASLCQLSLYAWNLRPLFNPYSLSFLFIIGGFFFVYHLLHNAKEAFDRKTAWAAAIYGVILSLKYVSWEVINGINYLEISFDERFAVSLTWVLLAVAFTILGVVRDNKGFRFLSFALFGIALGKILLLDLSMLAIVFRVMILLIVGTILVGVSFIYQRNEKKVEK